MKKILLFSLGGLLLLSLAWVLSGGMVDFISPESSPDQTSEEEGDFTGMSNPSAVYCQELGYEFNIVQEARGERGVCLLPENQECDAWDFLGGECGQEHSYCAQQGLETIVKQSGKNGLTQSYAVCVDENQVEIGIAAEMMDLSQKSLGCGVGLEETRPPDASGAETAPPLDFAAPASFDWRNHEGGDWLTPIRNQGDCGSCWAFSVVGVAEAAINIARADPSIDLDLSEQYLVSDCYPDPTAWGGYQNCCGGWKDLALEYIRDEGIPDDDCMPYDEDGGCYPCTNYPYPTPPVCGGSCNDDSGGACSDSDCSERCGDWAGRLVSIENFGGVDGTDRDNIKQYLVEYGPLSVSMRVESSIQTWDFNDPYTCALTQTNHAVVIVGYGDVGPGPDDGYWIVRNSWGPVWANSGNFNVGYGECGIENAVYYVIYNDAPEIPSDPVPADAAGDILINFDLSWTGGDPNPGDTVTYDVYFEAGNPSPAILLCDDATTESCDPGTLLEDTTYYWQVIASDQHAESTTGPVWSFTTEAASSLSNWTGFYSAGQVRWFLKTDHEHGWNDLIAPKFGPADSTGWIPVSGDWNGDGVDYVGFYSVAQQRWFLKTNHEHGWNDLIAPKFGPVDITGWFPVAGDWNGDGIDNVGFYCADQHRWFLKTDHEHGWNNLISPKFGPADINGWIPVAGDWNGDGVDYVGFYSVAQIRWFLKTDHEHGWDNLIAPKFGPADITEWTPIAGDWNGDGVDYGGFYSVAQVRWFLKTDHTHGWNDLIAPKFGPADNTGWTETAGGW